MWKSLLSTKTCPLLTPNHHEGNVLLINPFFFSPISNKICLIFKTVPWALNITNLLFVLDTMSYELCSALVEKMLSHFDLFPRLSVWSADLSGWCLELEGHLRVTAILQTSVSWNIFHWLESTWGSYWMGTDFKSILHTFCVTGRLTFSDYSQWFRLTCWWTVEHYYLRRQWSPNGAKREWTQVHYSNQNYLINGEWKIVMNPQIMFILFCSFCIILAFLISHQATVRHLPSTKQQTKKLQHLHIS